MIYQLEAATHLVPRVSTSSASVITFMVISVTSKIGVITITVIATSILYFLSIYNFSNFSSNALIRAFSCFFMFSVADFFRLANS